MGFWFTWYFIALCCAKCNTQWRLWSIDWIKSTSLRFFHYIFFLQIDNRTPDVILFLLFHNFLSKVLNFLFPSFLYNNRYPCPHIRSFDCVFIDEIFYSSIRSVFKYQLLPLYLSFKWELTGWNQRMTTWL